VTIEIEGPEHKEGMVKIKIHDSGPGIPEEILPKIFDPFFTTKEVGKGMGLGLAISNKLMEECRGSIDVTSTLNAGTTVTLEFPTG
jgi:signal transduction histidine kinase